jgi:phosphate:Na+ symporter
MRVSAFHVIFNVTTTVALLPFVKQLVAYSCRVIRDENKQKAEHSLKYVDDRLLSMPSVALMQVKKEIHHMFDCVEENILLSFGAMEADTADQGDRLEKNEAVIDFTNSALTKYLINLSSVVEQSDERVIGSYFHVLNDLERIGDHAENFYEIGVEMRSKKIVFSEKAREDIQRMQDGVRQMLAISRDAFENLNKERLSELATLEDKMDELKKELTASHFARLADELYPLWKQA